ncbi:MAG: hypothetical protein KF849_13710 [Rhizobiaceae bacterium]|nr:hypothetical protein [Rhizobiaceae bacterium]
MDDAKPWYLSRTIWASLITVLLAVAGIVGVPVAAVDGGALADAIVQAVTAILGVVAILGRLNATRRIG